MKLLVVRPKNFIGPDTIGDIFINGVWWAHTLEDEVRPAGVKIQNKTAIPADIYKVVMDFSGRWQKDMPHILNVPGLEQIE